MKLVVTGASGFFGRNVLLGTPRDWEVVAVYRHTADLPAFVEAHGLGHVRPMACDLADPDSVAALMREAGGPIDAVLYLAANGDPAVSAERPRWDLESNAMALVTFLERCRAGHFVFVSSGAVYDGLQGAVSPASPCVPRLPYAISKLASEHYVRYFAERRGSLGSYLNVRAFGAYGPYEAPRKITTKWLRAVMGGQREFTVRGNGENLIDFMYVDDAVDGLLRLVRASGESGTVDFASGAPVTVNQVIAAMARTLDVEIAVTHSGHTEEYIQFRSVDPAMRERFGFVPRVPFEDGLARLHAFLAAADTRA